MAPTKRPPKGLPPLSAVHLGTGTPLGTDGEQTLRWRRAADYFHDPQRTKQGMMSSLTALERAYELARSGGYSRVTHVKEQLAKEGYSTDQIAGGALFRQLREIIKAAAAKSS